MKNPIDCAERNFMCKIGPAKAFFEFDGVRAVYVAYAAGGSDSERLNDWMIDGVLKPLLEKGGHYLYWRLPEKIEFRHPSDDADLYRIYTRIAVLDKDFNSVLISDMVKPEGYPMRELDDEE